MVSIILGSSIPIPYPRPSEPATPPLDFPAAIHVAVSLDFEDAVDASWVKTVVETVLAQEGPFDAVEVTVRIADDQEIQELNRKFRGVDHPTDVLSFATQEPVSVGSDFALPDEIAEQLGDVVISYPAAVDQAKEYGHDLRRELGWLIVHGMLQLLGFSHETEAEARVMRAQEERALSTVIRLDGQSGERSPEGIW